MSFSKQWWLSSGNKFLTSSNGTCFPGSNVGMWLGLKHVNKEEGSISLFQDKRWEVIIKKGKI